MPPPSAEDDATLLALVQRGDEPAMAALFDRYSKGCTRLRCGFCVIRRRPRMFCRRSSCRFGRSPDGFLATKGSLAGGWRS